MSQTKEKLYILQLKKGKQEGFDALYKMYSAPLYNYCYKYIKSHVETEEIIQDVFIKLWINKETISAADTVKYWLFTVAKNQLINRYRAKVNSPVFQEYVNYREHVAANDSSSVVEYDDFCKILNKAKKHLSPTQRKVFDLSKHSQFSLDEIAETLSLSKQTVKNQLVIALKILREYLKDYLILFFLIFFRY